MNIIIVLGSARMNAELQRRFGADRTSVGEPISVVLLDRSEGVVERDEAFLQATREASIREYFFGDAKRTLSPFTQQVDFDGVVIYKATDRMSPPFSSPKTQLFPLKQEHVSLTWVGMDSNGLRRRR